VLVPAAVQWLLTWGGFALGMAAFVFVIWRLASTPKIPPATVAQASSWKPIAAKWLPIAAVPLMFALGWWGYTHDVEYVLVDDGGDGQPVTKRRYGDDGAIDGLQLAPGVKPPTGYSLYAPTWVINRSHTTLRARTIEYGHAMGFGSDPVVIPPGTSAHFSHVEHIGPDDRPPTTVTDDVKLGWDSRTWLTW
jgi:hypothetical protein